MTFLKKYVLKVVAAIFCVLSLQPISANAQTDVVRFETNVGNFDLTLNPTGNPNLEPYVDNLLAYVNSGRYDNTLITRADEGFVIQWGLFQADATTTDELEAIGFSGLSRIEEFEPLIVDADNDGQVDFDTSDLNNVAGTVSFALSALGPNSATSSIFVNLADNSFLLDDLEFVPFAFIEDLTTINAIANLQNEDLSEALNTTPGNLIVSDVPILGQNELVIVQRAFVVPEPATLVGLLTSLAVLASRRRGDKF